MIFEIVELCLESNRRINFKKALFVRVVDLNPSPLHATYVPFSFVERFSENRISFKVISAFTSFSLHVARCMTSHLEGERRIVVAASPMFAKSCLQAVCSSNIEMTSSFAKNVDASQWNIVW